jgi:lauroyl/myristoyl acyltransferase
VIALTAHMGNFLILMTRLTLEGYDVDLLVKKMKDKKVEQGLQDLRQELTLVIEPPLELSRTGSKKKDMDLNVQKYTDVIQSYVQKYPDQWTWNHKQWAQ